jgi:hypothetical protein
LQVAEVQAVVAEVLAVAVQVAISTLVQHLYLLAIKRLLLALEELP